MRPIDIKIVQVAAHHILIAAVAVAIRKIPQVIGGPSDIRTGSSSSAINKIGHSTRSACSVIPIVCRHITCRAGDSGTRRSRGV